MKSKKIITTIVLVLTLLVIIFWIVGFLRVDRCLDRGGRWDYEYKSCEFKEK